MRCTHPKQWIDLGKKLFEKIYRRKRYCGYNNDIHFMARDIDQWLPQGVQSLLDGNYDPVMLKRYYLPDEVVDHVHLSDRICQHVLLQMIKPTFQYIINPHCYHMQGPAGVKKATAQIQEILQKQKPKYFIRADIRSYYQSIVHYQLIDDLKLLYDDTKLIYMLGNIINNPIEAPYGDINPYTGLALRGPLSQFFSAIYLKPLDDTMQKMDVDYLRYNDDILILCKTKRQLNRCKRRMMEILHERHLKLSRRKTRMGKIEDGFHFLGISYPQTQPENNTDTVIDRIVPHARTLRKARENVKHMVADSVSRPKIRSYFFRWLCWWATSGMWERKTLLQWFIDSCWDAKILAIALDVQEDYFTKLHSADVPLAGVVRS